MHSTLNDVYDPRDEAVNLYYDEMKRAPEECNRLRLMAGFFLGDALCRHIRVFRIGARSKCAVLESYDNVRQHVLEGSIVHPSWSDCPDLEDGMRELFGRGAERTHNKAHRETWESLWSRIQKGLDRLADLDGMLRYEWPGGRTLYVFKHAEYGAAIVLDESEMKAMRAEQ